MADPTIPTKPIYITSISTPFLGRIWIGVTEAGLAAVEFGGSREEVVKILERRHFGRVEENTVQAGAWAQQVSEYLVGQRQEFTLPIDWSVLRSFQAAALREMYSIPFGQTLTYAQIAARLGKPAAARAVGRAGATNPMPLVIPCHRVVGSDGKLHGYGGPGGIPTKARLLKMEREAAGQE